MFTSMDTPMTDSADFILERIDKVLELRDVGRAKHYKDIQNGLWTEPVTVGRSAFWPLRENLLLQRARIAGASEEQIKQLVRQLHAERKTFMPDIGAPTPQGAPA